MITPTSGTALVGGSDVRTDIHKVRESLGLCPQHNVLFEELTVREHLYFFGKVSKIESSVYQGVNHFGPEAEHIYFICKK